MPRKLIVSATYNFINDKQYHLHIAVTDDATKPIYTGGHNCVMHANSLGESDKRKEKLIDKNVRNILYRNNISHNGDEIYIVLRREGDLPKPTLFTKPVTFEPKPADSLKDKRIWSVVLINGNPTIVRCKNEYLSADKAKDLLMSKIMG